MRKEETKHNNLLLRNADLKSWIPLQMWNKAFFVYFIDLSTLKTLVSTKQSKKKMNKLVVNSLFLLLILSRLKSK